MERELLFWLIFSRVRDAMRQSGEFSKHVLHASFRLTLLVVFALVEGWRSSHNLPSTLGIKIHIRKKPDTIDSLLDIVVLVLQIGILCSRTL